MVGAKAYLTSSHLSLRWGQVSAADRPPGKRHRCAGVDSLEENSMRGEF